MSNVQSPCIKLCVMDDIRGTCLGCGRSLAEIGGWLGYSATERAAIMAVLPGRLQDLAKPPANQPGMARR